MKKCPYCKEFIFNDNDYFFNILEQKYHLKNWTLEGLIKRIEKNEELNDADFLHQ